MPGIAVPRPLADDDDDAETDEAMEDDEEEEEEEEDLARDLGLALEQALSPGLYEFRSEVPAYSNQPGRCIAQ